MFTRTLCAALSIVPMSAGVAAAAGPFSGPMHEKHGGEVVFANTPIPMDAATDDNLIAATSLDKPLFVRTWGADSADNLSPRCKRDARLVWWASVNGGERISVGLSNLSDEARKEPFAASFSGDAKVPVTTPTVVGADLDPGPDRIRDWNGALVPRLVEGTNAVHVWITIDCGYGQDDDPIVAKGDLTIEVKKGALDAYAKKYGPFLPKARHPESRAVGAKLAAAVAREWPNEDVVGSGVLVSPGWFVQRDEWTGVPVARSSDAWVVVHLKEQPLATVCRAFNVTARQAAMDGRRFSPDVELGGTGGNVDVPCAAAKLPGR